MITKQENFSTFVFVILSLHEIPIIFRIPVCDMLFLTLLFFKIKYTNIFTARQYTLCAVAILSGGRARIA